MRDRMTGVQGTWQYEDYHLHYRRWYYCHRAGHAEKPDRCGPTAPNSTASALSTLPLQPNPLVLLPMRSSTDRWNYGFENAAIRAWWSVSNQLADRRRFRRGANITALKLPTYYRGAGVLFSSIDSAGTQRFLLGKRLRSPFRGYWTVPGGRMDRCDQGDFRTTAAREVFEETIAIPGLDCIRQRLLARLAGASESRIHVPFVFDFRVFSVPLPVIPDLNIWPHLQHWGNEFERFGWFDKDHFPEPLHPGMGKILRQK
jgi:8-oxo-dGTP pyrophosphatase MutT (NUDIX family)